MTTLEVPHLAAINTLPTGLLYPHQADGVSFLISKGRAILGDDMGLGKTRQAIVGMQVAAPTGMVLVVCPASLKLNWRREIRMVDPDAKIEVLGVERRSAGRSALGDRKLRSSRQECGTSS